MTDETTGTATPEGADDTEVQNTGTPTPEGDAEAAKAQEQNADEISSREDAQPDKEGADDDEGEDTPKPKKSRAAERISDLTRDKRNLQRQVARLNQKIGQLQASQPIDRDQFESDADYQAAITRRATQQIRLEDEFEQTKDIGDELATKRSEVWQEQVAEIRNELPDFDEVFTDDLPVTDLMADYMTSTDVGARMGYYLGKNKSVAKRIAAMSDPRSKSFDQIGATRELARLEAKMQSTPIKRVSQAPKPVTTIGGKAAGVGVKPLSAATYEEYVKRRQAGEG